MKQLQYMILGALIGGALVVFLSSAPEIKPGGTVTVASTDTLRQLGSEVSMAKYYAIKLPKELSFAGEPVPMHDFEVRERLDRELTVNSYWHSNTIQNLKLAHRWFPVIEKILAENNIPDDFKYVALAESGLRNVVSPASAEGVWQFLAATGRQYGLIINDQVDERYDVEKSTLAATKYLAESYKTFNNWTLTAAAYNAGIGAIEKNLIYQDVSSYYDLYLNTETSRYVFRILAFKVIYENTEKFGFMLDEEDLYDPLHYSTVRIDTSIADLAKFAAANNTNYKMLKYFNPWLRKESLTVGKGESYTIRLPDSAAQK